MSMEIKTNLAIGQRPGSVLSHAGIKRKHTAEINQKPRMRPGSQFDRRPRARTLVPWKYGKLHLDIEVDAVDRHQVFGTLVPEVRDGLGHRRVLVVQQVEAADYRVEILTGDGLGVFADIADSGVRASGDDDRPVLRPKGQRRVVRHRIVEERAFLERGDPGNLA